MVLHRRHPDWARALHPAGMRAHSPIEQARKLTKTFCHTKEERTVTSLLCARRLVPRRAVIAAAPVTGLATTDALALRRLFWVRELGGNVSLTLSGKRRQHVSTTSGNVEKHGRHCQYPCNTNLSGEECRMLCLALGCCADNARTNRHGIAIGSLYVAGSIPCCNNRTTCLGLPIGRGLPRTPHAACSSVGRGASTPSHGLSSDAALPPVLPDATEIMDVLVFPCTVGRQR